MKISSNVISNSIIIQNIITPYRARLFNCIAQHTDEFEVYYMAKSEPDRSWDVDSIPMNHKYWLDKFGLYVNTKWYSCHINPLLFFKILFNRHANNVILAGGAYHDPNIIALVIAKKLHITRKRFFFWSEANYLCRFQSGESKLKTWLRRFVYNTTDGAIIIPGKMSEITLKKWGVKEVIFIKLPNTINDLVLTKAKNRIEKEKPTFLVPMRLIESLKGIKNFFDAIGIDNIKKVQFLIAGDGPDEKMYLDYIREKQIDDNVKMLGFCQASEMVSLYNKSDVLLLPSFTDPSPLSLVEGLYYGMPILCSDRCGNHYEVVDEGVNGYVFSPFDHEAIKKSFETLLKRRNEWDQMGAISFRKYLKTFETEMVVKIFIEQFETYKK